METNRYEAAANRLIKILELESDLAEKDKEIEHLKDLLQNASRNLWTKDEEIRSMFPTKDAYWDEVKKAHNL